MPDSFINMIGLLFQDAIVFVDINNQVLEPFEFHRGVCQGCPIAPYVFMIVVETWSSAHITRMGWFVHNPSGPMQYSAILMVTLYPQWGLITLLLLR